MVLRIEPGAPTTDKAATPPPLPPAEVHLEEATFKLRLPLPAEQMMRCDLLVQVWGAAALRVTVDGREATPRQQGGGRWTLSAYDLRVYHGRTLDIEGGLSASPNAAPGRFARVPVEVWLIADQEVDAPAIADAEGLPLPISQQYRRLTKPLILKLAITVAP